MMKAIAAMKRLPKLFAKRAGPVGRLDLIRSGIGASLGLLVTSLVALYWIGTTSDLPILIAPMGASSVLLFAVPASPLARPWSVFGGNVLSGFVGVACAHLVPTPVIAAPLAGGAAIVVMRLCRCLHPPGGAVALTAVLGGSAIAAASWSFAFGLVALNSAILVSAAWLFNNVTGHRYPHRATAPVAATHATADPAPQSRVGFVAADIDAVLTNYNDLLDVSLDDLEEVFRAVEARAHARLHGALSCAEIMSRDVVLAHAHEDIASARDRLLRSKLMTMPVVDAQHRVEGVVGQADFLMQDGRTVRDIMRRTTLRTLPDLAIDELLPALSSGAYHEALVCTDEGRLLGIITQTDLIAALWRGHVAEQVASSTAPLAAAEL